MKKLSVLFLIGGLSACSLSWAADSGCSYLPQITLQLTAEQWVTTQTAKVSIALDAVLNKEQIAQAQTNFQNALKKIAPEGTWHITEFTRSPGKTDLEQLHAVAQARLPEQSVAGLRERAKAQNNEGQTYSVQEIVYTPTTDEIATAQAQLRNQIYNQAKAELEQLNHVYAKSSYVLYNINFVGSSIQPGPMMMKTAETSAARDEQSTPSFSQLMTQDAVVVLAAPPGSLCR